MTYYALVVRSWLGIVRDLHPVPAHVKRVAAGCDRRSSDRHAGRRAAERVTLIRLMSPPAWNADLRSGAVPK